MKNPYDNAGRRGNGMEWGRKARKEEARLRGLSAQADRAAIDLGMVEVDGGGEGES